MCRVRVHCSAESALSEIGSRHHPTTETLLRYYNTPTPSKRDGTSAAAIENSPPFTYNILNIYYIRVLRGHRTLVWFSKIVYCIRILFTEHPPCHAETYKRYYASDRYNILLLEYYCKPSEKALFWKKNRIPI